jgi:L-amino acid N-acyltransferase
MSIATPDSTPQTPPPPANLRIRPATPADLPAINDIFNHYVLHTTATYTEQPTSLETRHQWLADHSPRHPVIVSELHGEIVAFAALAPFRPQSAYRNTAESSLYVRPDMHRRGIGSALLADLIGRARRLGHHSIIAIIDSAQEPSLRLHRRFGFQERGRLLEAGQKFGRRLDVVYLQLLLDEQVTDPAWSAKSRP